MVTQFITLELPLTLPPSVAAIEQAVQVYGDPLRWAIARIDNGVAVIEAVVLQTDPPEGQP
jgi:hypothetical protein